MKERKIILSIENMSKSFGPTTALKNVSVEFARGQVVGLIGENGSGKSTLCNIISGQLQADEGEMYYEDKLFRPTSNIDARDAGVAMIVQEMGTIDGLSVSENVFLGKESHFKVAGFINKTKMNQAAQDIFNKIGYLSIVPSMSINKLSFENRKIVEIVRSLYFEPEILIVDETTTSLSHDGRELLYKIIKNMKEQGKCVIFISHDLDEIVSVCDVVTILRDGVHIDTLNDVKNVDQEHLKNLMVGREVSKDYYRSDYESTSNGQLALKCENVSSDFVSKINLHVDKGEILGIVGLAESGMHQLGQILFGLKKPFLGSVSVINQDGTASIVSDTEHAIKNKIGYVSKNRDKEALMLLSSIKDNIVLPSLDLIRKGPYISPKSEKNMATTFAEQMEVKMRDIEQYVIHLSGGNKQKVVLAKWLANGSDILILDCPTRGIDIGVKSNIYEMMKQWKKEGKAIIMISEELPEAIGMSDRILVFKDGAITKEFERSESLTEQEIIQYMI